MGYLFDATKLAKIPEKERIALAAGESGGAIGVDRTGRRVAVQEPDDAVGDAAAAVAAAPEGVNGERSEAWDLPMRRLSGSLVVAKAPAGAIAEEYRAIRTQMLARCDQRGTVHAFSSVTRGEGATTTVLNLALSFAEIRGCRVIAVEADLRGPGFARLLDLESDRGLAQVLRGEASLEEVIQPVHGTGLWVIAAGDCTASALGVLCTAELGQMMAELRGRYDHVLVDTPPASQVSDASVVGAVADELVVVARVGRTATPLLERTVARLRSCKVNVAGVLLRGQR